MKHGGGSMMIWSCCGEMTFINAVINSRINISKYESFEFHFQENNLFKQTLFSYHLCSFHFICLQFYAAETSSGAAAATSADGTLFTYVTTLFFNFIFCSCVEELAGSVE